MGSGDDDCDWRRRRGEQRDSSRRSRLDDSYNREKRRRHRSPERRRRRRDEDEGAVTDGNVIFISPKRDEKRERKEAEVPDLPEDDEPIDQAELDGFVEEEEEDEEAVARRAAERRAKRQVARHRESAAVAATSQTTHVEKSEPDKDQGGEEGEQPPPDAGSIRFRQTELGLAEERREEASFDMFGTDSVDETADARHNKYVGRRATAAQLSNDEEQGNWDDGEGYYMARPGEVIESRYKVLGVVGRGVFSSVLRAKHVESGDLVAVKMIRNNDTMTKAAMREIELLREIAAKDPDDRCHCVRLVTSTQHRNHAALVFESMAMNLREALRKYGKHVGINVAAVKAYARQLFAALRHLRRLGVVHADIKPDNILVSENNSVVKLCDFGSAFRESDPADPAPYLVSRFYRAPEIILGLKYDHRIDLWSLATCLFELYEGRVMFAGADNNQMLAKIMDLKGRFPVKMIKAHCRVYRDLLVLEPHFVEVEGSFKFQHRVLDKRTNEPRLNFLDVVKAKHTIAQLFLAKKAHGDDHKAVIDLADLLEQCTALNPDNRPAVSDAAKHKFFLVQPVAKPALTADALPVKQEPPVSSAS